MIRFRRGVRAKDPGDDGRHEDKAVRQYRFLLRTAPTDALEAAHAEALPRLSALERADLLRTVQETLMAGQRLTSDDHAALGHLMTLGERRTPGVLLSAYPAAALQCLAEELLTTDAVFGLLAGYAEWDGVDPEPKDHSGSADAGFNPDSGRWNLSRKAARSLEEGSPTIPGQGGWIPPPGGG